MLNIFKKKTNDDKEENFFPPKVIDKNENLDDTLPHPNPFDFSSEFTRSRIIFENDGVDICAEACSCCWDTKLPNDYRKRIEYLGRRCKTGHTSILEHSNLIIGVFINNKSTNDLIEFLAYNRYLHCLTKPSYKDPSFTYLIVGGSWRAYIDLFNNLPNMHNSIFKEIKKQLYLTIPKEIMYGPIAAELMDEDAFAEHISPPASSVVVRYDEETKQYEREIGYSYNVNYENSEEYERYITPVNYDNIFAIKFLINSFIQEPERPENDYFSIYEIGEFGTISICFKDMSRTATHQLVRHRNGITQESQRYVDYSNAKFINPLQYSADRYKDKNPKLHVYNFGNENMTLEQLGNKIASYYSVLVNDKECGLHREDARAFLPSNIACGKLYMTFTFSSLAKFIELRDHKAAQSEIKAFAHAIKVWFNSVWNYDYDSVKPDQFLVRRSSIIQTRDCDFFEEAIKEEN